MLALAAPDKFRGSLSAAEVARALAEGARRSGWQCRELPLADGGEGTLEALGGANRDDDRRAGRSGSRSRRAGGSRAASR